MNESVHYESPDGKAPEAFRTIGEVARMLGLRQHVLRYWEEQFPQLRPLTRAGNRRYYRPDDVVLLREIDRLLNQEGFTIRGARQFLETRRRPVEGRPATAIQPQSEMTTDPAIAHYLRVLRNRLAGALERDSAAA